MGLRVGIDLVAVSSVAESLRGPHRDHYVERVYTAREVEDSRGASGRLEPERLAARFAAKEAAIKALPGAGEEIALTQVEVVRAGSGEITLGLAGRAAELFAAADAEEIVVSITHESGFAAATVVMA